MNYLLPLLSPDWVCYDCGIENGYAPGSLSHSPTID